MLSAERIHADDTTVPVLAKLKTVIGRRTRCGFGTHCLSDQQRFYLFEIVEVPIGAIHHHHCPDSMAKWHDQVGAPTVADAVLDRIVHAHRIELQGDSMRKQKGAPLLTATENGEINHP